MRLETRWAALGWSLSVSTVALTLPPGCAKQSQTNGSRAEANPPAIAAEHNRMQFAEAMRQINAGMSPDEVRRILGEPDDVVTDVDLPPNQWSSPFVNWNYGTSGHNTFPMLGTITFDDDGVVLPYSSEADEEDDYKRPALLPPPIDLINEFELRHLLEKIHTAVNGFESFAPYDPLRIIQAVNALQAAGTTKAIASIREYVRIRSGEWGWNNVFGLECVLKATFDTGGAIAEPPGLWTEVDDLITAPQHPLLIMDGIPFLIGRQGGATGAPMPPEDIVLFFEKFGQIRSSPLVPPDRPVEALQKLIAFELADSQEPTAHDVNQIREEFLPQIRMLIRSANPLELDENGVPMPWAFDCEDVEAPRVQREIEELDIRWNANLQNYVRGDGTFVCDEAPLNRARIYWRPASLTLFKGRITLKRSSPAYAWVDLEWEQSAEDDESQFIVQFASNNTPLLEFQIPRPRPLVAGTDELDDLCRHITTLSDRVGSGCECNGNPSAYLRLQDGQSIRVDVLSTDRRQLDSREFTP